MSKTNLKSATWTIFLNNELVQDIDQAKWETVVNQILNISFLYLSVCLAIMAKCVYQSGSLMMNFGNQGYCNKAEYVQVFIWFFVLNVAYLKELLHGFKA